MAALNIDKKSCSTEKETVGDRKLVKEIKPAVEELSNLKTGE